MKLSQIIEKSPKELEAFIVDQQKALADHAVEMRTKKLTNVKHTAAIKKTIAQALTIRQQRQLTEASTDKGTDEGAAS